ncbi:MAG: hypothetical protein AAB691_02020 [Patescibacteria group bacterium]
MNKFERAEEGGSPTQEAVERRLPREAALQHEEGVMDRFRGRAKTFARAMIIMSAISFGAMAREASAGEGLRVDQGESVEEFEDREAAEERAVAFLDTLRGAKAPDRITHPGQKRLMAEEDGRTKIQIFAAQEKNGGRPVGEGETVKVSFQELCGTLDVLNQASGEFADRYLGNKDGKVDGSDVTEMQKASVTNPGFKALVELTAQCR